MNYAEIKEYDIANGPGVRMTLFVSGCRHHCKNCFNEIAYIEPTVIVPGIVSAMLPRSSIVSC